MTQSAQEAGPTRVGRLARVASLLRSIRPRIRRSAGAARTEARPQRPPPASLRSESQRALHLRALRDIARLRFGFPTAKYPHYKTYLNHPRPSMGVQMADGSVAYPDIVVVQAPENYVKILAQVETVETVNEDAARYEWRPYAKLAPLYLYVPVGKGDEALRLCRKHGVPVVGIRTWRYIVGHDEIEINNCYDV